MLRSRWLSPGSLVFVLWGVLAGISIKVTIAESELPNIILIITDDQDIVLNGMVSFGLDVGVW